LYAIGGLALRGGAARRVRAAKGRAETNPLPLVAADLDQVRTLCAELPAAAAALGRALGPGPLTVVLPAAVTVPEEVTSGTGTVAVRIPASALTRGLCALAGPLVSTSANRSGEPPAQTCEAAIAAVGDAVEIAIDAGPGRPVPSTIVDLCGPEPRLLRPGAVSWDDISRVLR
jgi:L-threonylcarbamoyladenylate synthase